MIDEEASPSGSLRWLARLGRVVVAAGKSPALWLAAPSTLLFVVFFVAPLGWMIRLSTYEAGGKGQSRFYETGTFTLAHYREILTDPYFAKLGWITVQVGVIITLVTMAVALPFAIYIYRSRGIYKRLLLMAVILPKLTNLLVLMYGVLLLLGDTGFINEVLMGAHVISGPLPLFANLPALVFGEVLIVLPYPVLMLVAAMESMDPALEEAAQSLGATPIRAFYETVLKLMVPALTTSTLVTLIWGFGAFVAPTILGSPDYYTVAIEVYTETLENVKWPLGAALATVYVAFITLMVGAAMSIQRGAERRWGGAA
jgi:ABC-type spermidine/putrescine transport system permease subunit I